MQPLPLSLEKRNHIQSSLEKWNDTENPSYLLHLHFTAEPLQAKWDVLRILRWFLNRTLVWSSTVSADGDFSVAVRLVELSLNIHHFLIWIVLWLHCVHSWNDKVSLIAMTALQNRPCVVFFKDRHRGNMIDLITQKGVPHQNKSCKEFHCRGALGSERGPSV